MMKINVENCPWPAKKSEAESRGHIPWGHLSGAERKRIFGRVCAEGVKSDLHSNISHRSLGPTPGDYQMVENGSAQCVDADCQLEEDVGGGRRGVRFAPWSRLVVTCVLGLNDQRLGAYGLGGLVFIFGTVAIFLAFLPHFKPLQTNLVSL